MTCPLTASDVEKCSDFTLSHRDPPDASCIVVSTWLTLLHIGCAGAEKHRRASTTALIKTLQNADLAVISWTFLLNLMFIDVAA